MKAHHIHFATGLGCLALVAFSVYYLQAAIGLLPCPLCVMQRIAFILFGITALVAAMRPARGGGRWLYFALIELWALAGAACYAVYQILTRRLSHAEHPLTLLFYTALVGTGVMSAALPWFWAHASPEPLQWLLIASLGIYGGVGHFLLIRAFRLAPASTLTPFTYVQLVWAALLGWLVFGHVPDVLSATGMAVIAAAGLWLALGERRSAAQARAVG